MLLHLRNAHSLLCCFFLPIRALVAIYSPLLYRQGVTGLFLDAFCHRPLSFWFLTVEENPKIFAVDFYFISGCLLFPVLHIYSAGMHHSGEMYDGLDSHSLAYSMSQVRLFFLEIVERGKTFRTVGHPNCRSLKKDKILLWFSDGPQGKTLPKKDIHHISNRC